MCLFDPPNCVFFFLNHEVSGIFLYTRQLIEQGSSEEVITYEEEGTLPEQHYHTVWVD